MVVHMVCVWPLIKTWDVRIEKIGYEMLRGQTNSEHLHPTHACRISNFESPPFFSSLSSILFMDIIFRKIYRYVHTAPPVFHQRNANHTGSTSKGRWIIVFLANLESRSVEKISIIRLMVCNCQLKYSITTANKKWIIWLPGKFSFLKWCL